MVGQNVTLDEAVHQFELYCKAKGLAPRTVDTYLFALECLRRYHQDRSRGPSLPSKEDLRAFTRHMLDSYMNRQTIRIRLRSIRVFCNFLEREGLVKESPMKNVGIPRVPATNPQILSASEMQRLLKAARTQTWYGLRNHAMIATFCDTGLRLGELVALDVEDVDLHSMSIRVRNGKGSKERRVYMGRTLARALRKWMEVHPFNSTASACFCTRDGRRLDKRNVARIIERVAHRAGLDGRRVHPHLLRHSFATHFIKNGGNPFTLQRLLGHSDIKTTMIYVNLAGADLEEAQAKASPLDRLS